MLTYKFVPNGYTSWIHRFYVDCRETSTLKLITKAFGNSYCKAWGQGVESRQLRPHLDKSQNTHVPRFRWILENTTWSQLLQGPFNEICIIITWFWLVKPCQLITKKFITIAQRHFGIVKILAVLNVPWPTSIASAIFYNLTNLDFLFNGLTTCVFVWNKQKESC